MPSPNVYQMVGGSLYQSHLLPSKKQRLGLFSEVDMIFHSTSNFTDSLGRVYSKKIKPFTYGDGEGKIPNFSRCVLYALSDEIDSLAKKSYKQSLINTSTSD